MEGKKGFTRFYCNGLLLEKIRGNNMMDVTKVLFSLKYSVTRKFQKDITIEYKNNTIYSNGEFH